MPRASTHSCPTVFVFGGERDWGRGGGREKEYVERSYDASNCECVRISSKIMSTVPPAKKPKTRNRAPDENAQTPAVPPPPFVLRLIKQTSSKTHFTKEEQDYMQHYGKKECKRLTEMLQNMKPLDEPRRLRVLRSKLPDHVKADIFRQLADNETPKFEEWVERALKLPLKTFTPIPKRQDHGKVIRNAIAIMNAEITGHDTAKQEVLRLICTWLNAGASTGFAIGLEGSPGVGKTSFAKRALARSMDRPFCFISLGGASDASGLLGHSYTYEGAVPGRLTESVVASQRMDPVIFFDELDKISSSPKGEEIVHALIHLTDPVQNEHIRDRYLHGIELDFSRAVLVFSYNDPTRVNPILLDRIKRIKLHTPKHDEKLTICRNHLIPRALSNFPDLQVALADDIVDFIVRKNAHEAGLRGIEKDIAHLVASYCLVKTYGSTEILGLTKKGGQTNEMNDFVLDFDFVNAVLAPEAASSTTSHLMMYS